MDDAVSLTRDPPVLVSARPEVTPSGIEVAEELLHAPGWRESHEKTARRVANEREGVRHTPGTEHRITRTQVVALVADFHDVLAGQAVEQLVFIEVEVLRRTALATARLLGEEEGPASILGGGLDKQQVALGQLQGSIEPALAAGDLDAGSRRCRRLRAEDRGRKSGHRLNQRSTSKPGLPHDNLHWTRNYSLKAKPLSPDVPGLHHAC